MKEEGDDFESRTNLLLKYEKIRKPLRIIYRDLLYDEDLISSKVTMFNNKFDTNIDSEELIHRITNVTNTTIGMKLHSFQYRLYMRAIITNIQLKHYKIRNDNLCSFCQEEKETIHHLFFSCKYVRSLWKEVASKFKIDTNKITYDNIFCNMVVDRPKDARNCIILIIKQYIYKTHCMSKQLSITQAEHCVKEYIQIEEVTAKSKNKLNMHKMKLEDILKSSPTAT